MTKTYRSGAAGALLDTYEHVIHDLIKDISNIPDSVLTATIDPTTTDENCQSIQTVLSHIVSAGYSYAVYIYNQNGHTAERPSKTYLSNTTKYVADLNMVVTYTENILREPLKTNKFF